MGNRPRQEKDDFRAARQRARLTPLVVHACYLINPCAADRKMFRRSVDRMARELKLSRRIGADYYVLHPGSHKGRARGWGIKRAADAICQALDGAGESVTVLLENTASLHGPGGEFARLRDVIGMIGERHPAQEVGLCLDTCHAFVAGYDFTEVGQVDRLIGDLGGTVGLERVQVLHLNDARAEAGSRRDRHEHIGRGKIGEDGLKSFLTHRGLDGLPFILETPWVSEERDRENLQKARRLAGIG